MDRAVTTSKCRFAHSFRVGGVCVAGTRKIFCSRTKFHGYANFVQQITGHWPNDVRALNAICLCISQNFHKAIGCKVCFCTTVTHEAELPRVVAATLLFQALFGFAD